MNARALGARGDGTTDDTAALQKAIDAHRTVYLPMGKYIVTDTLTPAAGQRAGRPAPERDAAGRCRTGRRPSRASGGRSRCSRRRRAAPRSSSASGSTRTASTRARWRRSGWPGAQSMMNDVRFLGGHGTTGLDGRRENPYNNAHSADPDLDRRWDSQYPSLWVTRRRRRHVLRHLDAEHVRAGRACWCRTRRRAAASTRCRASTTSATRCSSTASRTGSCTRCRPRRSAARAASRCRSRSATRATSRSRTSTSTA